MSKILALKYRPQRFADVKGQDHVVNALLSAINQDRLPHSLIFSGLRGTGKTTLARLVAKRLNCLNPQDGDVCDMCDSCLAIKENRHLDVMEIDGASYTGVDNIREIIESSYYKAVMGKYRVFIIDEVHMLSKNAFNALLKNLEEPAPHVCYILATTELHKVPDTILSRCMRCQMALFSVELLVQTQKELLQQENIQYDEGALFDIAYAADGSMRDAQTLLNQALLLSQDGKLNQDVVQQMLGVGHRQDAYALLEHMLGGEVDSMLTHVRKLIQTGVSGQALLTQLMDLVYWVCCIKTSPHLKTVRDYPELDRAQGAKLANLVDLPQLHMVWQILQKGQQEYTASPLKTPTLEMILMRLCFVQDMKVQAPISTPNKSNQPWATFDQLVQYVRQKKEAILFNQLSQQFSCVSYQPGVLVLKGHYNKPALTEITQKLNQLTGISWRVTIEGEDSAPADTFNSPPHFQPHMTQQDPALPDVVADLAKSFPDMVVTVNS